MNMRLLNPSTVLLPEHSDKVQRFLSFTDRGVQFQIKKLKEKFYWQKSDPEGFEKRLDELKSQLKRSLVMQDEIGQYTTYAGLWQDLRNVFGWELESNLTMPEPLRMIPWAHEPEHKARYYQIEATAALFANAKYGPAAIELPTGAGKSRIIHDICHQSPVETAIVTPSATITNQLYVEMQHLFGKKFVGKYGDGRKDLGKLFTVCTGQALTRLVQDTDEHDFFSKIKQFVWDESHTTAAETFDSVCLGPLKNATNRFFCSATQIRNDGSELLLRGITGPVVYRKDFKELVEEGFLARPFFKIFNVPAYGFSGHRDANKETRTQLYLNPNVNKLAADFAYKAITLAGRQTVILIEEFEQFLALKNYITVPFEFVHGGASNRENADGVKLRDILPKEYWESDTEGAISRFNSGETKLLIGTSAISTGVDLRPTGCLIYLQGGLSEIKVKQSIGRGTRITPTKSDCIFVDFRVVGSSTMERHADHRVGIYQNLGDVQEITR
jgi:superfamily II DNA or RNA helicase